MAKIPKLNLNQYILVGFIKNEKGRQNMASKMTKVTDLSLGLALLLAGVPLPNQPVPKNGTASDGIMLNIDQVKYTKWKKI
jgi:hypothetical protein